MWTRGTYIWYMCQPRNSLRVSSQNVWTKLHSLFCDVNLVWCTHFEHGLGISCTYVACILHLCNIALSTSLYHRLHLYHMLWKMCFSHIHWSLWYVVDEPMIMLDVLLWCIAMLLVILDMYACEMTIILWDVKLILSCEYNPFHAHFVFKWLYLA
jgi:hypothetical protein